MGQRVAATEREHTASEQRADAGARGVRRQHVTRVTGRQRGGHRRQVRAIVGDRGIGGIFDVHRPGARPQGRESRATGGTVEIDERGRVNVDRAHRYITAQCEVEGRDVHRLISVRKAGRRIVIGDVLQRGHIGTHRGHAA